MYKQIIYVYIYFYPALDNFHSTFCIGLQDSGSPSLVDLAIKLSLKCAILVFTRKFRWYK